MGKRKYLDNILRLFDKSPIITFSSVERIVNRDYAKQVFNSLVKQGKIKRLTNGYYTKHEDPSLLVFCFGPSYLGLQSALSIHGLWEQETIPIILTSKKARIGLRNINGSKCYVRRINKKYMFGFEYLDDGGFYLPYSDLEKTVIDFIVFNEKITNDVLVKIKKRINKDKLNKYLGNYSSKINKKVQSVLK